MTFIAKRSARDLGFWRHGAKPLPLGIFSVHSPESTGPMPNSLPQRSLITGSQHTPPAWSLASMIESTDREREVGDGEREVLRCTPSALPLSVVEPTCCGQCHTEMYWKQAQEREGAPLVARLLLFPWCKFSHHGHQQATNSHPSLNAKWWVGPESALCT